MFNLRSNLIPLGLAVLCTVASSAAFAHGGRVHFGINFGAPWYPPIYYPPVIYSPPVVVTPQEPTVYIEQAPVVATTPAAPPNVVQTTPAPRTAASPPVNAPGENYWYYCKAAQKYYPYVSECPSGWQRVSPQPPDLR